MTRRVARLNELKKTGCEECSRPGCDGIVLERGLCEIHFHAVGPLGDRTFEGTGKLRCAVCGGPLIDHSMQALCKGIPPIELPS